MDTGVCREQMAIGASYVILPMNEPTQDPAQSTRYALNQIRSITFIMALVGFTLFVAGAIWWSQTNGALLFRDGAAVIPLPMKASADGVPMMIAGAALLACAVVARAVAGRCKACQRRVSRPFSCGSGPMKVSGKLRFCPYCAASIDDL